MLSENFIIVEHIKKEDIETMLSNLTRLYSDTGFTDGIQLSKHNSSNERFLITFKNTPDLEHFAYFINYILYPEDLETGDLSVTGFYQIRPAESTQDFKPGDWLQMYVSKSDTAYNNVSIVNSANEGFLFHFGGEIKKLPYTEQNYLLPDIDKSEYNLLKATSTVFSTEPDTFKPWWKVW